MITAFSGGRPGSTRVITADGRGWRHSVHGNVRAGPQHPSRGSGRSPSRRIVRCRPRPPRSTFDSTRSCMSSIGRPPGGSQPLSDHDRGRRPAPARRRPGRPRGCTGSRSRRQELRGPRRRTSHASPCVAMDARPCAERTTVPPVLLIPVLAAAICFRARHRCSRVVRTDGWRSSDTDPLWSRVRSLPARRRWSSAHQPVEAANGLGLLDRVIDGGQ